MPETLPEGSPRPKLSPRERVAAWEPILRDNGWTVRIAHTQQRARLEATHPSGAVVMVTSGIAGRTVTGNTKLYVLPPAQGPVSVWLGVRRAGMEHFIRTSTVTGYRNRLETKCRCRTGTGTRKTRHATKKRAKQAMNEARQQRLAQGERQGLECRTYRCPDDDRVWHVSSRPSWQPGVNESPLWSGEASCA